MENKVLDRKEWELFLVDLREDICLEMTSFNIHVNYINNSFFNNIKEIEIYTDCGISVNIKYEEIINKNNLKDIKIIKIKKSWEA